MNTTIQSIKYRADLMRVLKHAGVRPVLTDKERSALTKQAPEYERLLEQSARYSASRIDDERKRLRNAFREDPSEENRAAFHGIADQPEFIAQRFRELRHTAIDARQDWCGKNVIPIAQAVYARLVAIVEGEYKKLEAIESKMAESFGVPFEPSETLLSIESCSRTLKGQMNALVENAEYNPRNLLSLDK
jgi:hypothetical protein